MPHIHIRSLVAAGAAMGVALGLGACSIGPVDLDDFLMTTSVADARAARMAELVPAVDDSVLKQPGTLTVGIPAIESAPLAVTGSDGSRTGLDVDLAHALADALGLSSVSFVSVTDVAAALQESCDVVMGVTADNSWGATLVGNYAQGATGIFAAQGTVAPIDASALSGASVGVQQGSVSQRALAELGTGAAETTFSNLNEAFDALLAGTVSYVACDAYSGAYLATAYDGVAFAGTLDDPAPTSIAVASAELQAPVQAALEEVQTNGVGDLLRVNWVGDLPTLTDATKVTGIVAPAPETEEEPAEDGAEGGATDGAEYGAEDGTTDGTYAGDATPAE